MCRAQAAAGSRIPSCAAVREAQCRVTRPPLPPRRDAGRALPSQTPTVVSCFMAVWLLLYWMFHLPASKPSSFFAAHLWSPLLAALLLMRRRLPADNSEGFPGFGEGYLEHLLRSERGEARGCVPASGSLHLQGVGGEPAGKPASVSCPLHEGPFFTVFATDSALLMLVSLLQCKLRKALRRHCTMAAAPGSLEQGS